MPCITAHHFVIAVPDLQREAAFYQNALAFSVEKIEDPGWLFFRRDGVTIRAGQCPDAIPPDGLGDHSYFAYLVVDNLEAELERVRAAGVEARGPWRQNRGMTEAALTAPAGHRIMLAQISP